MTATDDAVNTVATATPAAPEVAVSSPPAASSLPEDPDLRRFAAELGGLWQQVSAWTTPLDESASRELFELMDAVRRQNVAAGMAVCSVSAHAGDLSALRAGWPHFSPGQKAVLNAATAYVLEADRAGAPVGDLAAPGAGPETSGPTRPGDGAQAALVVSAAVRALLHRS
jgi:hypothetical protein